MIRLLLRRETYRNCFQVVKGLIFIHGKGIIHLDMKPNNIVCVSRREEDLRVKIIDFGLARNLNGEESIPITTCGTPEFMSPEVCNFFHSDILQTRQDDTSSF